MIDGVGTYMKNLSTRLMRSELHKRKYSKL
jgi:hypothetical protein